MSDQRHNFLDEHIMKLRECIREISENPESPDVIKKCDKVSNDSNKAFVECVGIFDGGLKVLKMEDFDKSDPSVFKIHITSDSSFKDLIMSIPTHVYDRVYIEGDGPRIDFSIYNISNGVYDLIDIFVMNKECAWWPNDEQDIALFDSVKNIWLRDPMMHNSKGRGHSLSYLINDIISII
jgi:hypothetical protein